MRLELEANRIAPRRFHFLGHVSDRSELQSLLAAADAFVHPNAREPFGIGPLEAITAGTPVIVPRAGGVLTYANDRNAWLAAPGDAGLASAICAALANDAARQDRVREGQRTAGGFAWPLAASRLPALYDHIHHLRTGGPMPEVPTP